MFYILRVAHKSLTLFLSSTGLFLSAWIILPVPVWLLLPLGVGAPEISPWLLGLNASASLLALIDIRCRRWQSLALGCSLVGILLSAWPLMQLRATEQMSAIAMSDALGADYMAHISADVKADMRPQPFRLTDAIRGIHLTQIRYTSGIHFATFDGLLLSMDIYRPPQVGEYPAIVTLYGGAWQSGSPAQNTDFNRYMAARGYTVFAIDYRHAPRYRFPNQLDDVRAALTFIHQHAAEYEADGDRIALLGRSSGAHLAMLAAYQSEFLPIQAVVSYYGPVDLTAGYANPPHPDPLNIRAVLEAFLGGSPTELPEQYRVASPISYVTHPLPPTLLVYGSRDHIVQVRFGQSLYERLRTNGSTAVLLEIPWAEHAFDTLFNGLSNQLALYYTERFLAWTLRQS